MKSKAYTDLLAYQDYLLEQDWLLNPAGQVDGKDVYVYLSGYEPPLAVEATAEALDYFQASSTSTIIELNHIPVRVITIEADEFKRRVNPSGKAIFADVADERDQKEYILRKQGLFIDDHVPDVLEL